MSRKATNYRTPTYKPSCSDHDAAPFGAIFPPSRMRNILRLFGALVRKLVSVLWNGFKVRSGATVWIVKFAKGAYQAKVGYRKDRESRELEYVIRFAIREKYGKYKEVGIFKFEDLPDVVSLIRDSTSVLRMTGWVPGEEHDTGLYHFLITDEIERLLRQ